MIDDDDDDETSDSGSRDVSRDLSSDANSSDDYEYDPKRRISTDDLRPQPIMRKSKKVSSRLLFFKIK